MSYKGYKATLSFTMVAESEDKARQHIADICKIIETFHDEIPVLYNPRIDGAFDITIDKETA